MAIPVSPYPEVVFTQSAPELVIGRDLALLEPVDVTVQVDTQILLDKVRFVPDRDMRIRIDMRRILRGVPQFDGPGTTAEVLPWLTIKLEQGDDTATLRSSLIPGKTSRRTELLTTAAVDDFIGRNFLTCQPQIIDTTPEQPQWLAIADSLAFGTVRLSSVLHANNGRSYTRALSEYAHGDRVRHYRRIDVGFSTLWDAFCRENDLEAIAYDIYGEAVAETGEVLQSDRPYAQRYYLRRPRYGDRCFGFTNMLGGFDTLMMRGAETIKPNGDVESMLTDGREREIENGYTSYREMSTGYIDTEAMAAQYRDFLKGTSRWVFAEGLWRRIVVDEYKVEHTPHELNAYTFKYHLAERDEVRHIRRTELPPVELPVKYFADENSQM